MLEDFIAANKLTAKVFAVTAEVHTSAKAVAVMGGDAEAVAKSIVLVDSTGNTVLVVLLGKDRIDFSKVKGILDVRDVRLAEPDEVLEMTGYQIGGVPPISIYGVLTIVDRRVTRKSEVICGGGTPQSLMRIKVSEMLEFGENVRVEDVVRIAKG